MLFNLSMRRVKLQPQWLALLGALLLLGMSLAWFRYTARQEAEGREKERLLAQTNVLNLVLGKNIAAANGILVAQAQEWASEMDGPAATRRLQALDSAMEGMRSLMILDKAGISQASSRRELLGRNYSEREYFRIFKEGTERNKLFISPPFRSVLGTIVIVLARPVFDKYGAFSGVVTATLDPDFFAPLLKAVRTTPDMRVSIAHGDGKLFILEPERPGTQLTNLNMPGSLFRVHLESGKTLGAIKGRLAITGEEGYWGVSTVQVPDVEASASLVVLVGRNIEAIQMVWRKDTLTLGIAFLFIATISCATMHLYMRRKQVTERLLQETTNELEAKARFLRSVTDGVPGMIGYWDSELRCQFANHAYLEWFGKSPEELIGCAMRDLLGEDLFRLNASYIYAALWGEPQTFERTLKKADGSIGYTLARYIPDRHDGKVHGFFVLVSDVTALKQTQAQLESLIEELNLKAVTDGLTGLANRRSFWEQAKTEIIRAKRYSLQLSLAMLDIDKFKSINDRFGHAAGDEVLRCLAAVAKTVLRETDVVGRLGGEEFGVLLPQTAEAEAKLVAERLRQAVEATTVAFEDRTIRFTISLGLAVARSSESSVDELLKRADAALYQAKETGRNRVCYADDLL